jgi:hypothetical protein
VAEFLNTLQQKKAAAAITLLNTYLDQGIDLAQFVNDVVRHARDQLLEAVARKESSDDPVFLQQIIEEFLSAKRFLRLEPIPQLPIELAVIRICGISSEQEIPVDFHKQEVDLVRPSKISSNDTVFETVPVMSLDEVKDKWPQVYEQIKSCNATLPLFMQSCEVRGVQGDRVELGFEYGLYVETVNQEKNRRVLEEVFEKVLGKRIRVQAVQTKKPLADETVTSLIQEFGGSMQ